jgi:hypothetical protein
MRLAFACSLLISASTVLAQANIWSHIDPESRSHLEPANLSDAQEEGVTRLLKLHANLLGWDCEGPELNEMIKGITFESIPLSAAMKVVLAQAPSGCARGGQGANGAMWMIRLDGATPTLLATPKEFSGWLFSIQPTLSHGYPDIILGWHMSGAEAGLSYMRFDGNLYRSVGNASLVSNPETGYQKIVPLAK